MAAKSPELYREALKYMNIHSGKIGRYAVQRTIEHLKRCNVVLDEDVKEMRINIPKPEQRGAEWVQFYLPTTKISKWPAAGQGFEYILRPAYKNLVRISLAIFC